MMLLVFRHERILPPSLLVSQILTMFSPVFFPAFLLHVCRSTKISILHFWGWANTYHFPYRWGFISLSVCLLLLIPLFIIWWTSLNIHKSKLFCYGSIIPPRFHPRIQGVRHPPQGLHFRGSQVAIVEALGHRFQLQPLVTIAESGGEIPSGCGVKKRLNPTEISIQSIDISFWHSQIGGGRFVSTKNCLFSGSMLIHQRVNRPIEELNRP